MIDQIRQEAAGGSSGTLHSVSRLSTKEHVFVFDSASLPYKFLTRLPGVCSGGEGLPPETLNGLTRNPLSYTKEHDCLLTRRSILVRMGGGVRPLPPAGACMQLGLLGGRQRPASIICVCVCVYIYIYIYIYTHI